MYSHSGQFRDVIALRDNERMRDLTRLTFESNERMQSLTQQTVKETKAMKALTLIALIYLPATFTATFLSMGYIHTTSVKGGLRLTVRKEMWIYLAITLPLLCVTFIFWFAWYYRNRKHEEETTLEAGKQKGGV
ncbi:MAG: hypothetical protein M1837_000661 [Sclerophora amabilis]|nr:MAG: hypothetical protein M1837_000661 [Sclerophora amabilis]